MHARSSTVWGTGTQLCATNTMCCLVVFEIMFSSFSFLCKNMLFKTNKLRNNSAEILRIAMLPMLPSIARVYWSGCGGQLCDSALRWETSEKAIWGLQPQAEQQTKLSFRIRPWGKRLQQDIDIGWCHDLLKHSTSTCPIPRMEGLLFWPHGLCLVSVSIYGSYGKRSANGWGKVWTLACHSPPGQAMRCLTSSSCI